MLEYQDGSFAEPEPLGDAIEKLKMTPEQYRALHVGSLDKLTRQRRRSIEREIEKRGEVDDASSDR